MLLSILLTGALCSTPLCSMASAVTAAPAAVDAPTLIASLKRPTPARTAYTEVRFSGLLDRPLILRGELEYAGPGKLGKRVDTPYREQVKVADGMASVRRGDAEPRTFSLDQAPELEGFLRGFAALLGGDAKTLAEDFTFSASGNAARWRLTLKPRDSRLARRTSAIDVDGVGSTPRCFRTREADGDVNVLLVDTLASAKLSSRPSQPQIDALCRGLKTP